jgi:hypothetical protein
MEPRPPAASRLQSSRLHGQKQGANSDELLLVGECRRIQYREFSNFYHGMAKKKTKIQTKIYQTF